MTTNFALHLAGLSKFLLPVQAVALRDSSESAKNSSLHSSVQSNYIDDVAGAPVEQIIGIISLFEYFQCNYQLIFLKMDLVCIAVQHPKIAKRRV